MGMLEVLLRKDGDNLKSLPLSEYFNLLTRFVQDPMAKVSAQIEARSLYDNVYGPLDLADPVRGEGQQILREDYCNFSSQVGILIDTDAHLALPWDYAAEIFLASSEAFRFSFEQELENTHRRRMYTNYAEMFITAIGKKHAVVPMGPNDRAWFRTIKPTLRIIRENSYWTPEDNEGGEMILNGIAVNAKKILETGRSLGH